MPIPDASGSADEVQVRVGEGLKEVGRGRGSWLRLALVLDGEDPAQAGEGRSWLGLVLAPAQLRSTG